MRRSSYRFIVLAALQTHGGGFFILASFPPASPKREQGERRRE
ncbi:MAG: hypothetical protein AAB699_02625 [Patescibacteria group bacterium]